jgi:DNA-binding transcriptional LysR family regulator
MPNLHQYDAMADPDLRHLRSFVAVAEEGHFGRAAQRLGIAQPAVSRHVRALEAALGAELLIRTSRRTELTDAGRAALERARALLADADRLRAAVAAAAGGETGAVRVGFVASTTDGYLAPLVAAVTRALPGIRLETVQVHPGRTGAALRRGDVDLVVARPLASDPDLVERPLTAEPTVAAIPAGHPLAVRDRLAPADLDGEVVIAVRRATWPAGYDASLARLREHGAEPREVVEAASVPAALALVAAGLGIYRLPRTRAADRAGVALVPIDGLDTVVMLQRRPEPPSAAVRAVEALAGDVLG